MTESEEVEMWQRLAEKYKLEVVGRGIGNEGLRVWLETTGFGASAETCLNFAARVPDAPEHIKLTHEGAGPGFAASLGAREVVTGDLDFDDLFWIESTDPKSALEYLEPERRALLLNFDDLASALSMAGGEIQGQASDLEEAGIEKFVEALSLLQTQLVSPPQGVQRPPAGSVNARQRGGCGLALLLTATTCFGISLLMYWLNWYPEWRKAVALQLAWPPFCAACGFGILVNYRHSQLLYLLFGLVFFAVSGVAMVDHLRSAYAWMLAVFSVWAYFPLLMTLSRIRLG